MLRCSHLPRLPFFNDDAAPSSVLVLPVDAQVPETKTAYDGTGRIIKATREYDSAPQATTTTAYPAGNETDVTPPAGGFPTAAITDARGQNTEIRQFHAATPTGTFAAIHYAYDAAGRQTALTASSGNTWTSSYDQLGDTVKTTDPDSGTITTAYDDDKEATETTDAQPASAAQQWLPLAWVLGAAERTCLIEHRKHPVSGQPLRVTRTVVSASPSMDFTGYRRTAVTVPIGRLCDLAPPAIHHIASPLS